jgi:hypothetical protein
MNCAQSQFCGHRKGGRGNATGRRAASSSQPPAAAPRTCQDKRDPIAHLRHWHGSAVGFDGRRLAKNPTRHAVVAQIWVAHHCDRSTARLTPNIRLVWVVDVRTMMQFAPGDAACECYETTQRLGQRNLPRTDSGSLLLDTAWTVNIENGRYRPRRVTAGRR